MKFLTVVGALVLVVAAFAVAPTRADSPIDVIIEDNAIPAGGVSVLVRHSGGEISTVSDANGAVTVQIPGRYFRLVVDGVALPNGYTTEQGTITVDLSDL
jgi:hypothetical protein